MGDNINEDDDFWKYHKKSCRKHHISEQGFTTVSTAITVCYSHTSPGYCAVSLASEKC